MDEDESKKSYAIGYARPPQYSRFKPGQSGNPKGKPKGAKNLSTIVNDAIKEKVVVTENGKRKTISKLEVIIKQMSNKAATGDPKAIQQLLPLVQMIESRAESSASTPALADADDIVMESIARRFRQMESPPVTNQAPSADETVPAIPTQLKDEN